MNSDSFSGNTQFATGYSRSSSRLESFAFYILLLTILVTPLVFVPSPYIVLDAIKTFVIALGTIISAICYGVVAYRERSLALPPKSLTRISVLLGVSLVISSFTSVHLGKSFFGQGFELTTASFLLISMVAGLASFVTAYRKFERIPIIYLGMIVPFIILAIMHLARMVLGPSFLSFGILTTMTSTLVGTWYDLATYSLLMMFIIVPALMFLPLSKRIRIIYWLVLLVSLIGAFVINSATVWSVAALTMLGLTIYVTGSRPRSGVGGALGFLRRLAWLPLFMFIIAGVFSIWGTSIAGPVITSLNTQYTTLSLPWQMTLDVDAGTLKAAPLFGFGPNHFGQAYLLYKPSIINTTYAWSAEFSYAFSLLATFVATQGIIGTVIWILFLVFLGMAISHGLRSPLLDPQAKFAIVSSSFATIYLWVIHFLSIPSHTILFFTYIVTGLTLASVIRSGARNAYTIAPRTAGVSRVFSIVMVVLVIAGVGWGVIYIKDTSALAYFGSGIKYLTTKHDVDMADKAFARAYSLNESDVYLQARAEAGISNANALIAGLRQDAPASTSQAILAQVFDTLNASIKYTQAAIKYDPTNYYNYVSEARVSEVATLVRMDKAYDNAVSSYIQAIQLNPFNPSLYLSLAQLQVSQNKLADAIKSLGASLQIKSNYLDAIFLLSQVSAAQGNLRDAITAAQVATQLNPNSAVLSFQLGLLQYNNKDYAAAAKALETATSLQADYANAQYFLGLSYARLNDLSRATEQFGRLASSNPDNQEVAFILANLRAGRSPFADAKPPVTSTPEKRSTLPIKEKRR